MGNSDVANAIREVLISPNVPGSNFEPANLDDTTNYMAIELSSIALAINRHTEAVKELTEALYATERR